MWQCRSLPQSPRKPRIRIRSRPACEECSLSNRRTSASCSANSSTSRCKASANRFRIESPAKSASNSGKTPARMLARTSARQSKAGSRIWPVLSTKSPPRSPAALADHNRSSLAAAHASMFEQYQVDGLFDEMFQAPGAPREHYAPVAEQLSRLDANALARRRRMADVAFRNQGITFTVYSDARGVEKIFPFDFVPRIIPADEWDTIEAGLHHRSSAPKPLSPR